MNVPKRPGPRKSTLANRSPLTPPTVDDSLQEPAASTTDKADDEPKNPKWSIYQPREETRRVRMAAKLTGRNLSEFGRQVVMAEVERLEEELNDSKPFSGLGPGQLPIGRPWKPGSV